MTLTAWDPASKQPYYKYAAVQVHKVGAEALTEKLADAAGKALDKASELTDKMMAAIHTERSRVADYICILSDANVEFVAACTFVAAHHSEEPEIQQGMKKLAEFSKQTCESLRPFAKQYGEYDDKEPNKLRETFFPSARAGAYGALRDLHALFVMASEIHVALAIVMQTAKELRDEEMLARCIEMDERNKRQ